MEIIKQISIRRGFIEVRWNKLLFFEYMLQEIIAANLVFAKEIFYFRICCVIFIIQLKWKKMKNENIYIYIYIYKIKIENKMKNVFIAFCSCDF